MKMISDKKFNDRFDPDLEDFYDQYDVELSYRNIDDLEFLYEYPDIMSLDLRDNEISDLTPLEALVDLQELYLSGNKIVDLTPLQNLKNLRILDLSSNKIKDISPLSGLRNLIDLYLSDNLITDISFIKKLKKLQLLFLTNNKIDTIIHISKLLNLSELYLENNEITDLFPIINLYNLKTLEIESNPLVTPPNVIARQGYDAIIDYFKQSKTQGLIPLYEAKILLVGEPGAGKTSLMKKLINPEYSIPNKEDSTLGFNIHDGWEFPWSNDTNITFRANIWDFGGQEIQYMLHQFFLTSRSLYIIVADDRKQHTRFDYWFNCIRLLGKKSPVLVILNEREGNVITNFDYSTYCSRYPDLSIHQFSVDLSNDSDGRINTLRGLIKNNLSNLKHIGDPLPSTWIPIRNSIGKDIKKNHISYDEYISVCEQFGVIKENHQKTIINALNDLGFVLYFDKDPNLRDFIFLNPSWTMDAVYTILSHKDVQLSNGKFQKDFLFEIWKKKYNFNEQRALLNLMLKDNFEICYQVDSTNDYLLPLLFPSIKPNYDWNYLDNLHFQIRYSFLPDGLLSRLIVRLNKFIYNTKNKDLVWENGVVLEHNGCLAEVLIEDYSGKKCVSINVSGISLLHKKEILNLIRNEIFTIHNLAFQSIEFEQMLSCNCHKCINSGDPHFFENSVLEKYYNNNVYEVRCDNSLSLLNVTDILDGVDLNSERKRKEERKTMNEIPKIVISPTFNNTNSNDNKISVENNITIEISNEIKLMGSKYQNIKEDILDEVELSDLNEKENCRVEKQLQKVENSFKELSSVKNKDMLRCSPALDRVKGFISKLEDNTTSIGKVYKNVEQGVGVLQDLAAHYNSVAQWCGLPVVPKPFLKK